MTDKDRRAWRRQMAECGHYQITVVEIDDHKYGICDECKWLMPGHIAEANIRLRSQ